MNDKEKIHKKISKYIKNYVYRGDDTVHISARDMLEVFSIDEVLEMLNNREVFGEQLKDVRKILIDTPDCSMVVKLLLELDNNYSKLEIYDRDLNNAEKAYINYIIDKNSIKHNVVLSSLDGNELAQLMFKQEADFVCKIIDQVKTLDINNLNYKQLIKIVEDIAANTTSADNIPMNLGYALRVLSEFDFSLIDEQYSILNDQITVLYGSLEVQTTVDHLQDGDLHFYLVKLNASNSGDWKKFASAERMASEKYVSYHAHGVNKALSKAPTGLDGFVPTLKLYDQGNNTTYISFVTDEKWNDYSIIPTKHIEMFVTVLSSTNSKIVSHVGISRGPLYEGDTHKHLAEKLHSFIAKAMLTNFPDKEYVTLVPANVMREILYKAFDSKNLTHKLFIGHHDTAHALKISDTPLDNLQKNLDAMKLHGYDKTDRMIDEYYLANIKLQIKTQQNFLQEHNLEHPVKVVYKENAYKQFSEVVFRSLDGDVIHHLDSQQMSGEFNWLFRHPYLISDHKDQIAPLVTIDYATLANLDSCENAITHEAFLAHINEKLYAIYESSAIAGEVTE